VHDAWRYLWGSQFADAGAVGHVNAESELGAWEFGLFLLSRLTGRVRSSRAEALVHPFLQPGLVRPRSADAQFGLINITRWLWI
jgi:hypothetical protein